MFAFVAPSDTAPLEYPKYSAAVCYAEVAPAYPASTLATALRSELESLMFDCNRPGWDGYGAEAVSIDAYHAAERFIRSLPIGIPQPDLSADSDGCVTFEWRKSPRRTLLVSVRPSYALDYAALIGAEKEHWSGPFFGELPMRLKELIQRVIRA